jgi:hypothetical protein
VILKKKTLKLKIVWKVGCTFDIVGKPLMLMGKFNNE